MLFDSKIAPDCSYCRFGTSLGCDEFACSKRGIMKSGGSCSSFRYEPTKRVPEALPSLMKKSGFSAEDFTL